ncbi:peptidoglycan-binding protein LysM [Flavobacterium sp. CBA20B-1]|uniref:peptidoglycan-binding protein LysM n=1 Tax=unclassified Flavobacterium TaxID=196869 RepID=UPI00222465E9|nr:MULTISPECIES: peptidoglycan-binding protein LysM [unclassified Flavobacterium]WCM41977.1 peptidoglycan-binding protein LysM [Flavobacterium sp. CBA20B-1]
MIKKCSYFIVIAFAVALITMAFKGVESPETVSNYYKVTTPLAYNVCTEKEILKNTKEIENKEPFSIKTTGSFIDFKEALALQESNVNYQSVNSYGYMGKYQFGKGTLKFIGIKNTDDFLNNPALQEKAFVAYIQKNKWILRREIKKYAGKTIAGISISESGMLAAAHLGGAGAVQDFLRSNGSVTFVDGYGTNIRTYLAKFANYDLKEIKAAKNPRVI